MIEKPIVYPHGEWTIQFVLYYTVMWANILRPLVSQRHTANQLFHLNLHWTVIATKRTTNKSDSQNKFSTRGLQFFFFHKLDIMGVMRALDRHLAQVRLQPGAICGLSFLLVLTLLRGFFYGFSGFPSHGINQHLKTHVDQD